MRLGGGETGILMKFKIAANTIAAVISPTTPTPAVSDLETAS
jgi:hypothetical protein